MKCAECQAENPETKKFCRKCGRKLSLSCPECGAEVLTDDAYCGECGDDLRKPGDTPPIELNRPHPYTPKHLTDKILTMRASIEGERKVVTILFADVVNSTAIFGKLDPEDVHQIMDGYFRILMDKIHRHEGTVNQFRGDCLMALFGAPVAHEYHAQLACLAALRIQRAMENYKKDMRARFGIDFRVRIGISSGLVVVGSIGDDLRTDYTADGDNVNVASRMESLARPDTILISENTYKLVKDYFEFEPQGNAKIKGKDEPQKVYVLLGPVHIGTRIAASAAKGLTPFVGRNRELNAIKKAYDKARLGQGQMVGIVGEAGVGKTRLLLELKKVLPQGAYIYFEGYCFHHGVSMPYLPILDVLRSYFRIKEGERESVIKQKMNERILDLDANLMSVIGPLQDLLTINIEDQEYADLEPKQKRMSIFEAIRDLLVRGSREKPLVLALEDLQWIDKTSEHFLDYMTKWLHDTSILVILLYRPDYIHGWADKAYFKEVKVDQFSSNDSEQFISAILKDGEVSPQLRDLILSETSGNALYMEELTKSLLENGSIIRSGNQYILSKKASNIKVPDTIQEIIAARVDHMAEEPKMILQMASVIGREFPFRLLSHIIEVKEKLNSKLVTLQKLGFIYKKRPSVELKYAFRHAFGHEVVYGSLLLEKRKVIHENIGKALEELYASRLEEFYEMLAYHYSRSGNVEKAFQFNRLSAQKAESNWSHREACNFYNDALSLFNKLPATLKNKKEKMKVIASIIPPLAFLGFPEGSLEIIQQGELLARELQDEYHLGKIHNALGIYYSHKGDPQLGMKYFEDAFQKARNKQDIDLMAPIAFGLTISYAQTGEYYKMVEMAPDVISLIGAEQRETDSFSMGWNPYSLLCSYCGHGMGNLGAFGKGKVFLEKGLQNATKMNDLTNLGLVEIQFGRFYLAKGDWEPARVHFENGLRYNEQAKWTFGAAGSFIGLGFACAMLGELERGKSLVEMGIEIYRDIDMEVFLSLAYVHLGHIYMVLGDIEKAQKLADRGLDLSQQHNERLIEAGVWFLLGKILRKTTPHKIAGAEECILKGIEISAKLRVKAYCSLGYLYLGQVYLTGGEKEKAIKHLNKAEGLFRGMGMDYWLDKAQESLAAL